MTGTGRFGSGMVAGGFALASAIAVLMVLIAMPRMSAAADPVGVTACSVQKAKGGLKAFVRAFNRGDLEKLDVLFDDEPGFQWFSMGEPTDRFGLRARNRSTVTGFIRNRHRRNDQLHIRYFGGVVKGHGGPEYERGTHFSFYLSRRADGFRGGDWFRTAGKGALVCAGNQPRIIVMSIGGPEPGR